MNNDALIQKNDRLIRDFFIFYIASMVFAAIGIITTLGLEWYSKLVMPVWTPPEIVVASVWGMLFVTTVVSLSTFCDVQTKPTKAFRNTILIYMGNAFLILLWNYLFFGVHLLVFSLWVAVAVAISVLLLIARTQKTSKTAAWLLTPYLLWMIYAVAINYTVLLLN